MMSPDMIVQLRKARDKLASVGIATVRDDGGELTAAILMYASLESDTTDLILHNEALCDYFDPHSGVRLGWLINHKRTWVTGLNTLEPDQISRSVVFNDAAIPLLTTLLQGLDAPEADDG